MVGLSSLSSSNVTIRGFHFFRIFFRLGGEETVSELTLDICNDLFCLSLSELVSLVLEYLAIHMHGRSGESLICHQCTYLRLKVNGVWSLILDVQNLQ